MAGKIYTTRNAFNAGEISELCAFRDDVAKYTSACLTLENAVPLVEGGAKKMPGTYFAGTTKNNNKSRLVPFQFSTTQGAILEFSAGSCSYLGGRKSRRLVIGTSASTSSCGYCI